MGWVKFNNQIGSFIGILEDKGEIKEDYYTGRIGTGVYNKGRYILFVDNDPDATSIKWPEYIYVIEDKYPIDIAQRCETYKKIRDEKRIKKKELEDEISILEEKLQKIQKELGEY